jgi:hypothetical protein
VPNSPHSYGFIQLWYSRTVIVTDYYSICRTNLLSNFSAAVFPKCPTITAAVITAHISTYDHTSFKTIFFAVIYSVDFAVLCAKQSSNSSTNNATVSTTFLTTQLFTNIHSYISTFSKSVLSAAVLAFLKPLHFGAIIAF